MGDHRASIKIEMEFHGIKDKCDMWINYNGWDGEYNGVDDRIIEFVRSVYEKGMEKYNRQVAECYKKQHKEEIEEAERKEYERLKNKYGS